MMNAVPRPFNGPLSTTALALAGLALIGFTGGAGTAMLMDAGTGEATHEGAEVHPVTNQAGLTSAPTTARPSAETASSAQESAEPATSTAPAKSESLPSSTAGTTERHPTGSSVPAGTNRSTPPAARAPVPPPRTVNVQPYQPPAAPPAPPPPPAAAPPPAPPAVQIPDVTLTRAPLVPQQPIQIQELRIG